MDHQLNEVLTRAKQALQQAQANPVGAIQSLQGAYDDLQRVMNEGRGQNLDTLSIQLIKFFRARVQCC